MVKGQISKANPFEACWVQSKMVSASVCWNACPEAVEDQVHHLVYIVVMFQTQDRYTGQLVSLRGAQNHPC